MDNRMPCKNENCKGTILPSTAAKTGGLCMPCFQSIKQKEREEYIQKNRKDINLYEGIDDPIEILKIIHAPKEYNPLIKYVEYPKSQDEIYCSLTKEDTNKLKQYAIDLINNDDIDKAEDILSKIVCFTSSDINDCLELLVNRGHYYPGVLFKGASQKIRDFLVEQVELDEENRNLILLALSWIGDSQIVELFNHWCKKQPSWKNKLYVSPEDYSFESGWTLTDDGFRKNLFSTKCYPLIHTSLSEDEPVHIITKNKDKCPWCNTQITNLFDFDLTKPELSFFEFNGKRLIITTCHICTCYGPIFTKINLNGLSKWHPANEKPKYLPNIANPEEFLEVAKTLSLSKVKRDPYYASLWTSGASCSQIGGHPTWIQDAEFPVCPEYSKHMKFIGQLDCSDFEQYGEGIYYSFMCEECNVAATHYQQS